MSMIVLRYGPLLSDDHSEVLRDIEADLAGGDADWRYAAYVYRLDEPLDTGEVVIPAGVYLRIVQGNTAQAWPVYDGDVDAYVESIEEEYLDDTGQ